MLEVKNLYCGYGRGDILTGLNFTAERGEIICIAGPNGSGKTTLLKAIACLLDYRGNILLDSTELSSLARKDLAKKTALLGQLSQFYFPYSIYETVALGRYAYSDSLFKNLSPVDKTIIEEVLERLELSRERNCLITELSGGQLQRVFLARTLVQDPHLVLLDEPTNHLDLHHQLELLGFLKDWAKEKQKIVASVLHDLNLAYSFADKVILLDKGKTAAAGKPDEVFLGSTLENVYGVDVRNVMRALLRRWS
ncbi:MAG: ABC transporter ATP-binding protein [Treponema sp.]|jgi:iron complex transport system ATP-binding protein|nr:ABC transporter ATP-binding protein [Treponema sp.]